MTVHRFADLPEVENQGDPLGDPIFWLGIQWAVTPDGVEARDGSYVIDASRVWEDHDTDHGWEAHMAEKGWVDSTDLAEALAFARQRWPRGQPISEPEPERRPGTFPFLECIIAWNPPRQGRPGAVVVGPFPDRDGWTRPWLMTDGATVNALHSASPDARLAYLFITFNTLVVRDGLDPQAVHRAFLAIDEYRARIARDTSGART